MNEIEQEHDLPDIMNLAEQATFEHLISPDATSLSSIRVEEGNTGTTKTYSNKIIILEDSDLTTL
jgi:hypothetical protein